MRPIGLSASMVTRYHRDGFCFPISVLSTEHAAELRRRLEAFEAGQGRPLAGELRRESHLIFTWLDALVRHPAILDCVEDLIGPNLLCWNTTFFIKEARASYVSWHQDATYWGLSELAVVTAWIALTDATVENGAMRMVPGTHHEQVAHRDTFAPHNILTRGQEIAVGVDEARAVDVVLRAGEMSLHHVLMFHSSLPNRSSDRRIGVAIRYVAPHVRQTAHDADSALLVRGVDAYHHFMPEDPPTRDCGPAEMARHAATLKRRAQVLYQGTAIDRFTK